MITNDEVKVHSFFAAKRNVHYRAISTSVSTLTGNKVKCVNVTLINNNVLHGEKSFDVNLKESHPYITVLNSTARVNIRDDDG